MYARTAVVEDVEEQPLTKEDHQRQTIDKKNIFLLFSHRLWLRVN
jgi:hypothetical protein